MVADVVVIPEEEIGVVAAFPQLHHEVGQGGLADLARVVGELQCCLAGNVLVDQLLPSRQLNLYHVLLLVGQFGVNFLFDSAQQERPKDLMQTVDNQQLFLLVQLNRVISCVLVDSHGEPFFEVVAAVEHLGQQEVEQRPQLA